MPLTATRRRTTVCAIAAAVAAVLAPAPSTAQSFDCRKATTAVEKMICASQELSKLDIDLAQAFAVARKRINPVVIGQPTWLEIVRNACTDTRCLEDAYRLRTAYLRDLRPVPAFPLEGLEGDWTRAGSTRSALSGLSISNVQAGSFEFQFFARLGERLGELEGTAATRGGSVFYRDDETTNCQVTFGKRGPRLVVVTSPECSMFGGGWRHFRR